jgi:hypothetical protein
MSASPNGTRNELKNLARRIERVEARIRVIDRSLQEQVAAHKVLRNDVRWIVKVAMAAASAVSVLIASIFQLVQIFLT